MVEIWKKINGSDSLEISSLGRVRNSSRILKCNNHSMGYKRITLNGKQKFVHRLVAEHFLENNNFLPQVNHKNGIRQDNRAENLEWISNTDNQIHSWNILKRKPSPGRSKLVLNLETGIYYGSAKEASDIIGITDWEMRFSLNGKSKLKTSFIFV